jgi:hypothetical protein
MQGSYTVVSCPASRAVQRRTEIVVAALFGIYVIWCGEPIASPQEG